MTLVRKISDEYRRQNQKLHETGLYGISGHAYAEVVSKIADLYEVESILDYGCGSGTLKKSLPKLNIFEYDPCILGKEAEPAPADLVICNDVLEHIEPEFLDAVLEDLARVTKKIGFYVVDIMPAKKKLPDGRNAHLIQETDTFWRFKIEKHLEVMTVQSHEIRKLIFIVRPK